MSWNRPDAWSGPPEGGRAAVLDRAVAASRRALVSAAFWTAVCLPVLLGGLVLAGISTRAEAWAFLALVGLEVLALVVGRSYARPG